MSDNPFLQRAVKGVQKLRPYIPGKPLSVLERELGIKDAIKLASNENPLGTSPLVKQLIAQDSLDWARYPDGSGYELTAALAKKHQIKASSITLGNGSNDLLEMVARVFLTTDDETIFSQYAFAVYYLASQAVGATIKIVPAMDYGHDLDGFLTAITNKTKVIWIANPNNPTGTWLNKTKLKDFLKTVPPHIIVVVDEAYIEYVNETEYPNSSLWLSEFENLMVMRTFSKVYGLASLRVGYCLSSPALADLLNRVRQPFNVNMLAQKAACIALTDQDFVAKSVKLNQQSMQQMAEGLTKIGCQIIPSVGNFILVDIGRPAAPIDLKLQQQGVITRSVENYGLINHLRISLGLAEENQKCLAILAEVLSED